jgi:hypothetical protein
MLDLRSFHNHHQRFDCVEGSASRNDACLDDWLSSPGLPLPEPKIKAWLAPAALPCPFYGDHHFSHRATANEKIIGGIHH